MARQRILCLTDDRANERTLAKWLAADPDYEFVVGEDALSADFDLAVTDGAAANRLGEAIRARREGEWPVFLPFLLVVSPSEVEDHASLIGTRADDLILLPLKEAVLRPRLDVLLRARDMSLELRRRYQRIFDGIPIGLFRAASDGRVLDGNAALAGLLGCETPTAAHGLSLDDVLMDKAGRPVWRDAVSAEGDVRGLEARLRRADGSVVEVSVNAQQAKEAQDQSVVWEGTIEDISERREREAERMAIETQLQETEQLRVLGMLASGLAHEVRNPLNAILTVTEALFQEIGDAPEFQPFLTHIRNQVTRLSSLMNDLLQYGRPVEPSQMRGVLVKDVCSAVLDLWDSAPERDEGPVELRVSAEAEGARIAADSAKLQQVFLNLIENAAQHSLEGQGIVVRIEVPEKGWGRVSVVDRGTGVRGDVLEKVFDPFFTTRPKGTGLGLGIVRQIVERHGGGVELVNNDPPPGCTAVVWLPLAAEETG